MAVKPTFAADSEKKYTNQVVKKVVPTLPKTGATYTTMAKPNPQTVVNARTTELIKQKAANNEKLDYATPEKQKIYDDYQKHLTGLIETKALNGKQLDVSNPWKQSIYDTKTKAIQDNIRGLVENGQQLNNANSYQKGLYDKYNLDFTTDRMTKSVNDEIAAKIKAYQDQLAQTAQASELAVNQNNAFLTEQLGKLKQNQAVDTDKTIALQNRRGNFYSGGTDYQLGQVNRGYAEAQGGLQRDVAMRNADIQGRNALLAQQASQNIAQLQQSAPGLIRERVLAELDRQRGIQMDEAQLTGMYNGAPTLENQGMKFNQGLAEAGLTGMYKGQQTMQGRALDMQETEMMAELTGYLPNGQPTTKQQQVELANLWAISEQTGVIHPNLAQVYGLPKNTPTYKAKMDAIGIAQENARINISGANAATSRMNANLRASEIEAGLSSKAFNQFMDVWKMTGKAPQGLEAYGIKPGQKLYDGQGSDDGIDEYDLSYIDSLAAQGGLNYGSMKDSDIRTFVSGLKGQYGWSTKEAQQVEQYMQNTNKIKTAELKEGGGFWDSIKDFFSGDEVKNQKGYYFSERDR